LYESTQEERISFWDHVKDAKSPLKCTVWGLNILETKQFIVMAWWDTHLEDFEERESNAEYVTILKSAIIERWKPTWIRY
jgi:hypothetical protein